MDQVHRKCAVAPPLPLQLLRFLAARVGSTQPRPTSSLRTSVWFDAISSTTNRFSGGMLGRGTTASVSVVSPASILPVSSVAVPTDARRSSTTRTNPNDLRPIAHRRRLFLQIKSR
jgi:hypothetical protein